MVHFQVKFDSEKKRYVCERITPNDCDPLIITLITPQKYEILVPNFPHAETKEDAIFAVPMTTANSVTNFVNHNDYGVQTMRQGSCSLVAHLWVIFLDIEQQIKIKYYHPLRHVWAYAHSGRLHELDAALDIEFVNFALEYDLKQFPLIQWKHSIDKQLFASEMESVVDDVPMKK